MHTSTCILLTQVPIFINQVSEENYREEFHDRLGPTDRALIIRTIIESAPEYIIINNKKRIHYRVCRYEAKRAALLCRSTKGLDQCVLRIL